MNEMSMISKLEKAKKQKIFKEVQKHGIKIGKQLHYMPEDIGASLYIDDFGDLHFPIIIQYDEFMQWDFIQDFPMNSTFEEQLNVVLQTPAPWDPTHRYKVENIDVFYETNITDPLSTSDKVIEWDDKYKIVDKSSTLLSVLKDKHYIVPQFPIFIVVAKDYDQYGKFTDL